MKRKRGEGSRKGKSGKGERTEAGEERIALTAEVVPLQHTSCIVINV